MTKVKLYEVYIKDTSKASGFSCLKIVGTCLADIVNSFDKDEILMVKYVESVNLS